MNTSHRPLCARHRVHRVILGIMTIIMAGTLLIACSRGSNDTATATTASGGRSQTPEARRASETPDARRATETARRAETPTPRPATVVASLVASNLGVAPVKEACPVDHAIKGRFEKKQQIYYVSGDRNYARTKPEICFASEGDAQTAGFQAAAR